MYLNLNVQHITYCYFNANLTIQKFGHGNSSSQRKHWHRHFSNSWSIQTFWISGWNFRAGTYCSNMSSFYASFGKHNAAKQTNVKKKYFWSKQYLILCTAILRKRFVHKNGKTVYGFRSSWRVCFQSWSSIYKKMVFLCTVKKHYNLNVEYQFNLSWSVMFDWFTNKQGCSWFFTTKRANRILLCIFCFCGYKFAEGEY